MAVAGIEPPRTHNLLRLITQLEQVESFDPTELDMANLLTPFGMSSRYPNENDDEPPVAELLLAARHLRDRLRPVILAELA